MTEDSGSRLTKQTRRRIKAREGHAATTKHNVGYGRASMTAITTPNPVGRRRKEHVAKATESRKEVLAGREGNNGTTTRTIAIREGMTAKGQESTEAIPPVSKGNGRDVLIFNVT